MNRPAPVEISYENMRFLITHNPTNATLNKFTEELKKYGVTTLVRVCDATYDKAPAEKEGIHVLDWPFDDGAPPPNHSRWLAKPTKNQISWRTRLLCCSALCCRIGKGTCTSCTCFECGMKYEDAVQFIRKKEGEHSIPNSCFTWRNTDLRCDYASEIPTGIAVFSKRNVYEGWLDCSI